MSLGYKIDVLAELKKRGYNTSRIRNENILSEGVLQSLRMKKPISWKNIAKLCELLDCEPGDILMRVEAK